MARRQPHPRNGFRRRYPSVAVTMDRMKLYADAPGRRGRQIVADVGFALWCAVWIWLGYRFYEVVLLLGAPGAATEAAGSSLQGNMIAAGEAIDGLPVVGESVRAPFDRMSEAGLSIAEAGRAQQEAVARVAWVSAVLLALAPIATLAVIWLPIRVRFIRRVNASQQLLSTSPDLELFALRALARQPIASLARISSDPMSAWRAGDPDTTRALAELELRDEGLRIPW